MTVTAAAAVAVSRGHKLRSDLAVCYGGNPRLTDRGALHVPGKGGGMLSINVGGTEQTHGRHLDLAIHRHAVIVYSIPHDVIRNAMP